MKLTRSSSCAVVAIRQWPGIPVLPTLLTGDSLMLTNMKVGTRLIAGFLFIVLLGSVVAAIGIVNLDRMNERARGMYQEELLGVSYAKEANIDLV